MKKVLIAASAILLGASAFAQTSNGKTDLEFQKYIAKKISYNTNFAEENAQGTILVKLDVNSTGGVENVNVVSGINSKIDSEVAEIVKNAPASVTGQFATGKAVSMVLPVRLVVEK